MMRRPPTVVLAFVLLAVFALVACRSSSSGNKTPAASTTAPAAAVTASGTLTPGATPSGAIRSIDLKAAPPVKKLLDDTGGQYVQTSVIYADLNRDGADDAVVPISSGGTLGDVAFIVLAMSGSETNVLISEYPKDAHGLAVAVVDGKLVETQPLPGPDDPECCPSMLRNTTYAWNGAALAVESVKTVVNPEGGAKRTPSGPPVSP
jgi:hypothetical protein